MSVRERQRMFVFDVLYLNLQNVTVNQSLISAERWEEYKVQTAQSHFMSSVLADCSGCEFGRSPTKQYKTILNWYLL